MGEDDGLVGPKVATVGWLLGKSAGWSVGK